MKPFASTIAAILEIGPGVAAVMLFALMSLAHSNAAAQTENPAPAQVTLPLELDAVLRAYEVAWGERDANALADLFTVDGFVLRPGHPPARWKRQPG